MTITINGSTGIDKVQDGTIQSADFAAGVPGRSNLPAGTVLQVVSSSTSTQVINNSGTFTDTGITITITPIAITSKVLIQAVVPWLLGTNGGGGQMQFRLLRDATELTSNLVFNNVGAIVQLGGTQGVSWVDSPSTTSAVTYKIQFRELSMAFRYGSTAVMPILNAGQTGTIQVLEIAA